MYITLYYLVTRLPENLRSVRDHFLSLCPTTLTVDLLEERLLAAETSITAVGASRGDPRTPFFEGCSPVPLLQSLASAAAVDLAGTESVSAASAPSERRRISKAKFPSSRTPLRTLVGEICSGRGAEADCYVCVPPDPGIEAVALGASESAAPGAGESALSGTASAQVFHTFTLDSGASRSFFRDRTTLTPLSRPVAVSLADPSGGPVLVRYSTVLPCPAAPSGSLSGLYLPSFSTNLVSGADLQDAGVDQFTPAGQRVTHCTSAQTGRHLAPFTRRTGSSLYTLTTESPPVAASGQVAASSQVFAAASRSGPEFAQCSCHLLSHQTLLWHHRLGHPSLPRLRGMASRVLVSSLPRSLPPLPPGPSPTCVPCVVGRQRAAPHSSEFPPTKAPLQTLHMDVWGPARVHGQGRERYFLLVVDDYSRYTTVFPLRSKGEVTEPGGAGSGGAEPERAEPWGAASGGADPGAAGSGGVEPAGAGPGGPSAVLLELEVLPLLEVLLLLRVLVLVVLLEPVLEVLLLLGVLEPWVREVLVLEVLELLGRLGLLVLELVVLLEWVILEVLEPERLCLLVVLLELELLEVLARVVLLELELTLGVLVLSLLVLEVLRGRGRTSFRSLSRFLVFHLLLLASPLPAPSPYAGPTGGLAERREPESRPASPVRTTRTSRRVPRPLPPAVPGTHQMTLRPSTAPQRVPLPSPPASSLPALADPASDSLRAASPTVTRLLATVVTDPSFESTAASALVTELVDFAAHCRLDFAASLVAESASVCPPSVG
ncbi:unnamed protein product, partial [Closterium sp. NIES-54]